MGNWIRKKYKRIFYNLNTVKKKSWEKINKTMDFFLELMRKEQIKWENDKWIIKTKVKCNEKIKKYWITQSMLKNHLEKKWYLNLIDKI